MTDIEKVVLASKRLETLLKRNFGAKGKGLHELSQNVGSRLPKPLVKKLHFVATLRNKIIHEEGYDRLDDPKAFDQAVKQLEKELAESNKKSKKGCILWFGLLVVGLGALALYFLMKTGH